MFFWRSVFNEFLAIFRWQIMCIGGAQELERVGILMRNWQLLFSLFVFRSRQSCTSCRQNSNLTLRQKPWRMCREHTCMPQTRSQSGPQARASHLGTEWLSFVGIQMKNIPKPDHPKTLTQQKDTTFEAYVCAKLAFFCLSWNPDDIKPCER